MKRLIFLMMIVAVLFFVFGCEGEEAAEAEEDVEAADEIDDEDLDPDEVDDDADEPEEAEEAEELSADTVEGLFSLLDQAIKSGDINQARALYDSETLGKLETADPALVESTVDGPIMDEIESRAEHGGSVQVSGSGDSVEVTFPSGRVISDIAVKQEGGEYKLDVYNSPDGDLLDF